MKYLPFFLLALTLAACTDFFDREIELPVADHEPRLSVDALFTQNDTLLTAHVTRTYGLNEERPVNREAPLEGATVQIFENGSVKYELPYRETEVLNRFAYDTRPDAIAFMAGRDYEIRVTHPDYPDVRATQTMPAMVELENVRYEFLGDNNVTFTNSRLQFDLPDPAGEDNFYELFLQVITSDTFTDPQGGVGVFTNVDNTYWYAEDLNTADAVPGFHNTALLISDEAFNGQRRSFSLPFYLFRNDSEEIATGVRVRVNWRHVTQDYYRYSRSLQDFWNADGNPLSEPVSVFSNVENGVGCFGLRNEVVYELE